MSFDRSALFGRWFRVELDENGREIMEIAQLAEDGSYEFHFTISHQENLIEESIEFGDWGICGEIHFTITKGEVIENEAFSANTADPDNYHAYKVLSLNNQEFTYQHVVSGEIYKLKRITENIGYC
ncbi:hypothetical protein [Thalassotalea fusca]